MTDTSTCPTCGTPLAITGEILAAFERQRRPDDDGQTCWLACPVCDATESHEATVSR